MKTLRHLLMILGLVFIMPAFSAQVPDKAAIASAHPLATQAGIDILAAGGNAFDAAISVTSVLAVVEPYSSGLGGGGFYLLYQNETQQSVMLDAREKSPLAAHRDMYLDNDKNPIKGLSMNGPLAAGIPGVPAALVHLAEKYGKLPLKKSLASAIKLAKQGFSVEKRYQRMAGFRQSVLQTAYGTHNVAAATFLPNGKIPAIGTLIKQPHLAKTLKLIANKGRAGFYQGKVAEKMVSAVRQAGGIWQRDDLAQYQVIERAPIVGHYHGWKITSAAPPSSGGIAMMTALNILSAYNLKGMEEAQRTHFVVEAMRRVYRDRAVYLGDPDTLTIPTKKLLSPLYAAGLRAAIHPQKAMPSELLAPDAVFDSAGEDTTHFSVLDKEGNRVAATLSINYPFGSGFMAEGTGVLLNDEMDDFSRKPGVPNAYGLVGGEANAIAPKKRPLSSMSPTFVENGSTVALLGTPGGSRIISMVLLAILELDAGKNIEQIVAAKRYHHQYLPDVIQYEPHAFSALTLIQLKGMGHALKNKQHTYGNMQGILWNKRYQQVTAASDPRGLGSVGYFPSEMP